MLSDRQKRWVYGSALLGGGAAAMVATRGKSAPAARRLWGAISEIPKNRARRRVWQGIIHRMNVARESLQPMPRTLTAAHKRAMDLRPAGTWHGIPIHQPTKASGEAVGPAFYLPSVTVPGIARELRKTGKIGEFNVDRMMEQRRAMQSLSERPSRSPMQINYTRGRSSANMRWEPEMKELADLSPEARAKWNKVRAHMKKMKGLEDELDRKIRTMPRRTLGI